MERWDQLLASSGSLPSHEESRELEWEESILLLLWPLSKQPIRGSKHEIDCGSTIVIVLTLVSIIQLRTSWNGLHFGH
jgi:hypothetical protein